jgi:hypothetical protein
MPLAAATPELSAECLLSAAIMFISQLYFVRQLWIVKGLGTTWWVAIIATCAILGFAGSVACVAVMYKFPYNVLANRHVCFKVFFGLAKGFGAITDILATTAMCMFLTSSRTGMPETNSLLTKLMRFVIHRGALVTLFQTALLISFYAWPNHIYWAPLHLNVTKLYANTCFAMLNGRQHLKPKSYVSDSSRFSTTMSTSVSMSTFEVKSMPA